MKSWLKKRRELRAIKKRWLREFKGGAVVISTQMAANYVPPSASVNPVAPTCTACRQEPGNDCLHFVAR